MKRKNIRVIAIIIAVMIVLGAVSFANAEDVPTVIDTQEGATSSAPVPEESGALSSPPSPSPDPVVEQTSGTNEPTNIVSDEPAVNTEPSLNSSENAAHSAEPSEPEVVPAPLEDLLFQDNQFIVPFLATNEATLRAEILAAAPGDTIDITGNIALTDLGGGSLIIDKNLTLRSVSGTSQLTVDNPFRHIQLTAANITLVLDGVELVGNAPGITGGGISATGSATINGAIIKNCEALTGGAISSDGNLILQNVMLTGNRAISATTGGGAVFSAGTLSVSNSTITQNTATSGHGGGIYAGGNITLNSGILSQNTAQINGGGLYSPAQFIMVTGTISNNSAGQDGGGLYTSNAFILGGTISSNNAVENGGGVVADIFTLENGIISGNTAGDNGGGVYSDQSIEINGGKIIGNSATSGGGLFSNNELDFNVGLVGNNSATQNGGGIYAQARVDLNVGATISENSANNGGGLFTFSGVTVNGATLVKNTATTNGGGIYSQGTPTMQAGTVTENSAGASGGGIYTIAGFSSLVGGTISKNSAGQDGGGFYGSTAFIADCTVSSNEAQESGGGLFVDVLTIEPGSIISNNRTGETGGGVHAEQSIEMNGGIVSGNTAKNGGGLESFGEVLFNSGTITGNTALQDGGGIYTTDLALVTAGPTAIFSYNVASRAYDIKDSDRALYAANILTPYITQPFVYAYNNYDINYLGNNLLYIYRVDFDSQGGSLVDSVSVIAGATVPKPQDPVRPGYTFTGWFKDPAATIPWDFSTPINSNLTLYAGWNSTPSFVLYTVTFDSQGGSFVAPIKDIVGGSTISEPAPPTREGYTFTGWYIDAAMTKKWVFSSDTVNQDLTLYAGWTPVAPTPSPSPSPSQPTTTTGSTGSNPKTGDGSNNIIFYGLIAVAGTVLITVLERKRKKQ